MLEKDKITEIPVKQRMERQQTLERGHSEEYRAALMRAVKLSVPDAYSPSPYGTFDKRDDNDNSSTFSGEGSLSSSTKSRNRESWDDLIERLFDKDESGRMVLKEQRALS